MPFLHFRPSENVSRRVIFKSAPPSFSDECPTFLLWVRHFVPIFMFICVFQAPRRPPKEGKQKHLFTPLLSRRDLEGGSVLGAAIPLEMALDSHQCRGQLLLSAPPLCAIMCFCDGEDCDQGSECSKDNTNLSRSFLFFPLFGCGLLGAVVCHLWVAMLPRGSGQDW